VSPPIQVPTGPCTGAGKRCAVGCVYSPFTAPPPLLLTPARKACF
jgi:hypothetical protein